MNKINVKNLIVTSLVLVVIFGFNFTKVEAKGGGQYFVEGQYILSSEGPENGENSNTKENPIPTIKNINPTKVESGCTNKEIIINGSGFVTKSVAKFNGEDRLTTYVNANKLIMELNEENCEKKGKNIITVFNPSPKGGYSNGVFLTVGESDEAVAGTGSKKDTTATTKPATGAGSIDDGKVLSKSDSSSLSANAVKSKNRLIPDTLIEWIVLSILILLAILLWRRIWVKDEERKAQTLKHA